MDLNIRLVLKLLLVQPRMIRNWRLMRIPLRKLRRRRSRRGGNSEGLEEKKEEAQRSRRGDGWTIVRYGVARKRTPSLDLDYFYYGSGPDCFCFDCFDNSDYLLDFEY
ncbi:hypothetical protein Tco_0027169 [Tanacetum coccineum]